MYTICKSSLAIGILLFISGCASPEEKMFNDVENLNSPLVTQQLKDAQSINNLPRENKS